MHEQAQEFSCTCGQILLCLPNFSTSQYIASASNALRGSPVLASLQCPTGLVACSLSVNQKHPFALLKLHATIKSKISVAVISKDKINLLTNKFKMPPQLLVHCFPTSKVLLFYWSCRNTSGKAEGFFFFFQYSGVGRITNTNRLSS